MWVAVYAGKVGAVDVSGDPVVGIQSRAGRADGAVCVPDRSRARACLVSALIEVAKEVLALPGMRQGVVAEAQLQAHARGNVPVVLGIDRRSLVGVVANWRGLRLGVAAGQAHKHIHEGVTRQRTPAVIALRIAVEHLVLGVAVVAEAELQLMRARGIGDVHLGRVVLGRIMVGFGRCVFTLSQGAGEGHSGPDFPADGISVHNRSNAP